MALYQAYQEYMSVIKAGYRTSPVSVPSSHDRYYGPSFMDYLNGGDHLALDELIKTVFYVGSGSTVTDEMGSGTDSEGNEYNFDFINDLDRINVRLNGETLDKKENDDGSYSFGEEKFLLAYDEAKDSFTFTIGTNITVLDELQIIYDVQLTNPQTVRLNYNVDNAIHVKIQSPDHTVVTNTHQVRISKVSDEGKPLSGPVTIKVDESGAVEDTFADVKDIKLAGAAIKFRK